MKTNTPAPGVIVNSAVHNTIAQRAYELWEQEGCGHGSHERHWAEALRQVNGSVAAESVKPMPPVEPQPEVPLDVPHFPPRESVSIDRRPD